MKWLVLLLVEKYSWSIYVFLIVKCLFLNKVVDKTDLIKLDLFTLLS